MLIDMSKELLAARPKNQALWFKSYCASEGLEPSLALFDATRAMASTIRRQRDRQHHRHA
jgi:hypothetical protein